MAWRKWKRLILVPANTNSEAFFFLFSVVFDTFQIFWNFLYVKEIFSNQIVETIILMLLSGLFPKNMYLHEAC